MDTERGVLNAGVYRGEKGRANGRGRWGGIAWGEMPNVGEGEKANKAHCMLCTCTPKPKMQKKKKRIKKKKVFRWKKII